MADNEEIPTLEGTPKQWKFKILSGETYTTYTLKGLMGDERAKYINFMNTKMEFKEDGTPKGLSGAGDLEMVLLGYSVYDAAGVIPITQAVYGKWPANTIATLIAKAGELSGFGAKTQEAVKNG